MRPARWPFMRRMWATVVPTLLVLAACTGTEALPDAGDGNGPTAPSSESRVDPLPDPGPPCALRLGDREVGLTEQQAVTATGLAARALRERSRPRALAGRLAEVSADVATVPAARAMLGYDGPTLSCVNARAELRDQKVGPSGLTARGEVLRRQMRGAFDDLPMGGFAGGRVSTGHIDNSSHYEGRAIDVFFRPYTDRAEARRGWVLAQWLVARADRLRVLSVIYRDRIWTVWASFAGWRRYVHPSGDTRNPVLRHLDHVHTAVLGGPYRGDD